MERKKFLTHLFIITLYLANPFLFVGRLILFHRSLRLLNRLKFGSELAFPIVPFVVGTGKVGKLLVQKGKELAYRGGNLQLIHGSRMFLCHSTLDLVPSVGDFYFFPNYLMHTVFPFKDTNEERRSISFNAVIDDEIYNVYGR